jgi:hypothetical protein
VRLFFYSTLRAVSLGVAYWARVGFWVRPALVFAFPLLQANVGRADEKGNEFFVERVRVAGNDVVLLLETAHYSRSLLLSHAMKKSEVEYWYVRKAFRGPLVGQPALVVGPLWAAVSPSFPSKFTGSLPPVYISPEGRLVWFAREKDGHVAKELKIGPKTAEWLKMKDAILVPDVPDGIYQKPRFETSYGERLVQRELDGQIRGYDAVKGRQFDDPWLSTVLQTWVSNPGLTRSMVSLTDDLKYVVFWPIDGYRPDGNMEPFVFDFLLEGKSYSRKTFAVYFERGSDQPHLIDKRLAANPQNEGPDGSSYRDAVSIEGRLLLRHDYEDRIELSEPTGPVVYSIKTSVSLRNFPRHDVNRGELLFWGVRKEDRFKTPLPFFVTVWNYKQGKVSEYDVEYASLFKTGFWGRLKPVVAVPVTN